MNPRNPSTIQQIVERCVALLLLLLVSPLLLLISAAVFIESGRPIFFKQTRVGRYGQPFRLWKFRTMRTDVAGPAITLSGDSRTTRVGRFLRKYKLDELPQLWNVVRAGMNFVGPRPEVPKFVDLSDPGWRSAMQVRPGITSPASIAYRNEESLLVGMSDPVRYYVDTVVPSKLAIDLAYLENRSFLTDFGVIAKTLRCAFFHRHTENYHPR
jgi:lipopolysaccharide/colanic/teichoic acid biosynthesis glycosyltransferase